MKRVNYLPLTLLLFLFSSCEEQYGSATIEIESIELNLEMESVLYAPEFFEDGVYQLKDGVYYDWQWNRMPDSTVLRFYRIAGELINESAYEAYDVEVEVFYQLGNGKVFSQWDAMGDIDTRRGNRFSVDVHVRDTEIVDYWADVYWYDY